MREHDWEKRVINGEVRMVKTSFDGRYAHTTVAATSRWPLWTILFGILFLAAFFSTPAVAGPFEVGSLIGACVSALLWRRDARDNRRVLEEHEERLRLEEERRRAEEERERRAEQEERRQIEKELRAAKEKQRRLIESLLHRDAVADEINYMDGLEFEKFMAALFRQKGYLVEETRASGDQGVDLILPDLDGKRVVIQLKRWTAPVGNAPVQATFAGMAHYQAQEGWIITTGTFTRSAQELARSTSVRLIDGKELADWLEGLREDPQDDAPQRNRRLKRRRS